jgi:hypothetical protein
VAEIALSMKSCSAQATYSTYFIQSIHHYGSIGVNGGLRWLQ